jgi:hypothetical protein
LPGPDVDLPLPSSSHAKNEWSFNSTSFTCLHGVNRTNLRFFIFYNQGIFVTKLLKLTLYHPQGKCKIKRTIFPVITLYSTDQGHRLISLSSQLFATLELFLNVLRVRM